MSDFFTYLNKANQNMYQTSTDMAKKAIKSGKLTPLEEYLQ